MTASPSNGNDLSPDHTKSTQSSNGSTDGLKSTKAGPDTQEYCPTHALRFPPSPVRVYLDHLAHVQPKHLESIACHPEGHTGRVSHSRHDRLNYPAHATQEGRPAPIAVCGAHLSRTF